MTKVRAMIAVVLAALTFVLLPGTAQAQSQMTFRIKSEHKYKAQVRLFSQDRPGHVWPGSDRAYNLDDSDVHTIIISCLGGEKICYGGWQTGNAKLYWGAGLDGRQACTNCCFVCNGGYTPLITLQ